MARRPTNKRILRKTLGEMEAIMQNASVGMVFTRDRRITRCNLKFAEMYGDVGGETLSRSGPSGP